MRGQWGDLYPAGSQPGMAGLCIQNGPIPSFNAVHGFGQAEGWGSIVLRGWILMKNVENTALQSGEKRGIIAIKDEKQIGGVHIVYCRSSYPFPVFPRDQQGL